jgi:DNA polymerase-3 subunit alpha
MNEITKSVPHEHEVNDQMEESGEESIIRWVLENQPDSVKDYVQMDDDGNLVGEYAQYFEQAIRLEGTYKTQGKHAAGIVLGNEDLSEICPMVRDPNGDEKLAGMDMGDLESMGLVKLDILGVASLDKLMYVNNLLQYGEINP